MAPDGLEHWRETFRICQAAEIWQVHGDWVITHSPDFGPGISNRFDIASRIDSATFAAANDRKAAVQARIAEIVTPETVLVLPTSPAPAPFRSAEDGALDGFRTRAFEMLCTAGLAGLPQLSVPVGRVDQGPVGLSLVGSHDRDHQLIALARSAGLAGP
jgi:amidase